MRRCAGSRGCSTWCRPVRRWSRIRASSGLLPHLDGLLDADDEPDAEDEPGPTDAVSVLTVHKAKGLEFRVVYVAGLADGRFPLRARPDRLALPAALRRDASEEVVWAEERRLSYVACTRARDELDPLVRRAPDAGRSRAPAVPVPRRGARPGARRRPPKPAVVDGALGVLDDGARRARIARHGPTGSPRGR